MDLQIVLTIEREEWCDLAASFTPSASARSRVCVHECTAISVFHNADHWLNVAGEVDDT
jgi:hypothetical protein